MGQVIQWPRPENRPERPDLDTDEPRGRILLFLGVRYERQQEPALPRGRGRRKRG
jgi:hypothetical protein